MGDTLTSTYSVTNTGNVTLSEVSVHNTFGSVTLDHTTLAPGESTGGEGTYTTVKKDVLRSPLVNNVTALGTSPVGDKVSDETTVTLTITLTISDTFPRDSMRIYLPLLVR